MLPLVPINPLTAEWALRALIDFTLYNARQFYSSMGNPLDGKGLKLGLFAFTSLHVHVAYPRVLWLSCFHSLLLAGVCKTSQLSQFCNPCRSSTECLLLTCSAMRCSMFLLIPDRLRWWPLSHLRWIIHLRQVICPIIHLYILSPH